MMGNKRLLILIALFFGMQWLSAQSVDLQGKIIATNEVDGIHVLNNTAQTVTISDRNGEFSISAKLNDTLMFSGVLYQSKQVIISRQMIDSKSVTIHLTTKVNVLDEVVVGKILTGDLNADIANSDLKRPIDFYDLGIPGYTGKPKTQTERRLYEAGDFKPIQLLGLLGGSMPLNPILNAISGRTKELKNRIRFENEEQCIAKVQSEFSERLFGTEPWEQSQKLQFFYFCADDPQFGALCALNNDFKMFGFLKEKLTDFKSKLQTTTQE